MAQQSIVGGDWCPSLSDETFALGTTTYVLDASGERAQLILEAPKTGNIQGFEAMIATVTNTLDNGLRFSVQAVDTATGLADGTPIQSVTTAANTPAAAGWLNPGNFGAVHAVTRGDLIALVVDNPSFTASDSIAVANMVRSGDLQFPYGVQATSTKNQTNLPIFALRYDDGSYGYICPELWGVTTAADWDIDTGTTPDEVGLAFSLPYPRTLDAVAIFAGGSSSTLSDFDVIVYEGSTALVTRTRLAAVTPSASRRWHYIILPSPISLSANTLYRVAGRPTSTNNVQFQYYTFNSLELMDTVEGGQLLYGTARTNAGSWTDYNTGGNGFRKPRISLLLSSADDGAGGGMAARVLGGTVVR